jgi:hypothetical protein
MPPAPRSSPGSSPEAEPVDSRCVAADPTETDPDKYTVVFENERVRVLEYRDRPGDRTSPHGHPDSVMVTLSAFERRLLHGGEHRDVKLEPGRAHWVAAQEHAGENIGGTETHVVFVELKESPPHPPEGAAGLGPAGDA